MKGRLMAIGAVLVAALAAGGVTAGAAEGGSLVLEASSAHDLAAYQVFAGSIEGDGSLSDITWGEGVDGQALLEELAEVSVGDAQPFAGAANARQLAAVISQDSGAAGVACTEAVARAAAHHLAQGIPFSGRDKGSAAGPLSSGYYIVATVHTDGDGAHSLVFPTLITVGTEPVELTPKEAAPTLVKQVLEDSSDTWGSVADAEIGESVLFSIAVSLPDSLMQRSHIWCCIVDELPKGVEANLDSVAVSCGSEDVSDLFDVRLDAGVLTLEAAELAEAGLSGNCELTVTYDAKLTAEAPIGAGGCVNTARLEIETDGERCTTPESKAAVITYRLAVKKVDAADHSLPLAGARFVLSREDGRFAVVKDGVLVAWTGNQAEATQLTSDNNGRIEVAGLDSDAYTLIEVAAPSGYQGLTSGIPLEIRGELSFDIASGCGAISSLKLSSKGSSSQGNTTQGSLLCTVENAKTPSRGVPTTGDSTQDARPFALVGGALASLAFCARRRTRRQKPRPKHFPVHFAASLLLAMTCLVAHAGCLPLRALAEETVAGPIAADDAPDTTEPEGLIIGLDDIEGPEAVRSGSTAILRATPSASTGVSSEADIPRSASNSYINVLNMSYENAYVMVNDGTNFAYAGTSPTNAYINWSLGASSFAGDTGQQVSSMVLYRGTPGAHGAGNDTWGIDTIEDRTGNGLVAIWFKDAGILSDTGEPVSLLLKLTKFELMPNYYDYFNYMGSGQVQEALMTYSRYRSDGYSDVPLLYIFKSNGLDQTNPANARVWMNSVWCCGQVWDVSFYRSSQIPSGSAATGYSMGSLDLSSDLLVSTATNGETYLARQYCYDLDIAGIRWLNPSDGSYSSTSAFVTPGNAYYGKGGAYLTSAGAESFAWVSGTSGSSYASNASNLKNDSLGGLTYWLHDYNHPDGGSWNEYRWESAGGSGNTDWRNALASDILPHSSFAWVGTGCSTGINLNSQFTGTGDLRVSKTVDDGNTSAFPFVIRLETPVYASGVLSWERLTGSFAYRIADEGGTVLENGNLQSGDTILLATGQALDVSGIPEGVRYTVTEGTHAGYQPVQTNATEPIAADEFVGTVVNGATSEVDITNMRLLAPATWSIVKRGTYGEKLEGAVFTLRYYAGDTASGAPARTWVLRSDADGRVMLDAAHRISGDEFFVDGGGTVGLPVGTVTIEETQAPSGYEKDAEIRTYAVHDTGGALECTIPAELTVENTRLTGTLVVSKQVAGTGADTGKAFSFSVRLTLDGSPLSGTFGGTTFTDGHASFTLTSGQSKTITGIPAGSSYEVSETSAAGYSVSWTGRTGSVTAGATATARATNTYSATGSARLIFAKHYDTNGPALEKDQFTFELHKDSPEGEILATASCEADGSITFELSYDQNDIGKSFAYYVTEVNDGQGGVEYDVHAAKAVVRVSDNGDGTLAFETAYTEATFTNSFKAYVLPSTGGPGLIAAVAGGFVFVVAAAMGLRRLRSSIRA